MLFEISAGINAGKSIVELVKWVNDVESRLKGIATQEELIKLKGLLNSVREERINERSELLGLKEELNRLNEILKQKTDFYFVEEEGVFRKKNPDNECNYTYCPKCMDGDNKVVHLRAVHSNEEERWNCPVCNWHGWSRAADRRMSNSNFNNLPRTFGKY